jgi:hypothetical protein
VREKNFNCSQTEKEKSKCDKPNMKSKSFATLFKLAGPSDCSPIQSAEKHPMPLWHRVFIQRNTQQEKFGSNEKRR